MSIQAMVWAMEQQEITDATTRHVLLCLANYADKAGAHAFPSAATLAIDTGLTERAIRMKLSALLKAGVITLGNQAIAAAHITRADRRPVVYDLCITGVNPVHPAATGCISRPDGVNLTTARGEPRSPNPSLIRHRTDARPARVTSHRGKQQPSEASGRQPDASEVLARSRPDPTKVATPQAAAAHLQRIAQDLRR